MSSARRSTTVSPRPRCRGCRCAPASTATPTGRRRSRPKYYEMFGSWGIWHQAWKAVTVHGPTSGMANFDRDRWQLFHTDEDRSEAHDLADQHPEKLEELKALWLE